MIIVVNKDRTFMLDNYDELTVSDRRVRLEKKYPHVHSSGYTADVRYDVSDTVTETVYSDDDEEKVKTVYNGIIDAIADSRTVNTVIKIADILATYL